MDVGVGFEIRVLTCVDLQGKAKIKTLTPHNTQSSSCTQSRKKKISNFTNKILPGWFL